MWGDGCEAGDRTQSKQVAADQERETNFNNLGPACPGETHQNKQLHPPLPARNLIGEAGSERTAKTSQRQGVVANCCFAFVLKCKVAA